jgi:hypothetical protein
MSFCDKDYVREIIQGKSVALVGSGPGVLDNKVGFIDSHDIVVRVSNYKIFEETGVRTDIFYSFFGNSITKPKSELIADGVYLCMCKCPNSKPIQSTWHEMRGKDKGIDFTYIYNNRANWWFCPTYVPTDEEFLEQFKLLGNHVPTTGFSAILDILSYNPKSLYLTGFDFFTSGIHNVDESWKQNNIKDPIGHVPKQELKWLLKNYKNYPILLDPTLQRMVENRYEYGI